MKIKREILIAFRTIRSICEEGGTPDNEKLDKIHKIADEMYEDLRDQINTHLNNR